MDALLADVSSELISASRNLSTKHSLRFGISEVLLLEYLVTALRSKAPMETDEYIKVFSEQIKLGREADGKEMNFYRNQLAETLTLTAAH